MYERMDYDPHASKTGAELKAIVEAGKLEGVCCPTCGHYIREYHRKLHTEMMLFLIALVKRYEDQPRWYKMKEIVASKPKVTTKDRIYGTDGGYLRHWGLTEKGARATCRPLPRARAFLEGEVTVPSHVYLVDNELIGWSETDVTAIQALGSKFSLEELLNTPLPEEKS